MTYDTSLLNYFLHAGIVVKVVMLLLIGASIFSWTYILQRSAYFSFMNLAARKFENNFWSGDDLSKLYASESNRNQPLNGLDAIFHSGFKEFFVKMLVLLLIP